MKLLSRSSYQSAKSLILVCPSVLALVGTLLMGSITPQSASAETVMEKVTRTGTLTAGTSNEAFPFAFDNEGELQGYSVDMLKQIQLRLSQELGQTIELKLIALNPDERIPTLLAGDVDIVCDASSYTWEREKQIDFSVSYGLTGTRLLGPKGGRKWTPEIFAKKRIAVVEGTTNEIAVRR